MKALVDLAQLAVAARLMGGGKEGPRMHLTELHLNVLLSEKYATKVPFSNQDNKKHFQF